ncbi:hypothetical protein MC885_005979, partial [Smutsia gigantea]
LQGSLDNMTCILVCFPRAPRPCEEAIRQELALDAALGRRVTDCATVIAEAYSQFCQASGKRWEVGPQENRGRKLPFPSYAGQRKEDKPMEEPQNAYFPFSYFPLTESPQSPQSLERGNSTHNLD